MRKSSRWFVGAAAAAVMAAVVPARAGALEEGEAAFAQADYAAASRAFQTALSAQGPSAGLYFNLGMSQMREGNRAEAAASFRRAVMLDPRMIDARMALSDVERAQGVAATKPSWEDWVAEKTSLPAMLTFGAALAWIGAFLLLAGIFRRSGRRFWRLAVAIVLLAAGGAVFIAGNLADPRLAWRHAAVIRDAEGASLRSAPADQSAVLTRLPGGAMVRVLQRSGDWTLCQAPTGERGWTTTRSLEPLVPAA